MTKEEFDELEARCIRVHGEEIGPKVAIEERYRAEELQRQIERAPKPATLSRQPVPEEIDPRFPPQQIVNLERPTRTPWGDVPEASSESEADRIKRLGPTLRIDQLEQRIARLEDLVGRQLGRAALETDAPVRR